MNFICYSFHTAFASFTNLFVHCAIKCEFDLKIFRLMNMEYYDISEGKKLGNQDHNKIHISFFLPPS